MEDARVTESTGGEKKKVLRGAGGKFLPGTRPGPGPSEYAKRMSQLKAQMFADSNVADNLKALMGRLWTDAIKGDNIAARIVLERLFGKAEQPIAFNPNELPDQQSDVQVLRKLLGFSKKAAAPSAN